MYEDSTSSSVGIRVRNTWERRSLDLRQSRRIGGQGKIVVNSSVTTSCCTGKLAFTGLAGLVVGGSSGWLSRFDILANGEEVVSAVGNKAGGYRTGRPLPIIPRSRPHDSSRRNPRIL
eukprot:scaffold144798_cov39-Attheya_sp.AAC.1